MHRSRVPELLISLLLVAAPSQQAGLDCEKIRVDGHTFNLKPLGGPHSVVTSRWEPSSETHFNTTYTVDICQPLKKSGKAKKTEECPNGTRACAITHMIKGDTDNISKVVAIAGSLENAGGSQFDATATRLKTSESKSDSAKEGVRILLKGGKHPLEGPVKERRPQQAIIEFLCDPEKEGTEGEWASEDKYERLAARDDKNEEDNGDEGESSIEHQLKNQDAALIWESYKSETDVDVLRLTWHTKHACEDKRSDGGDSDESPSTSWGFFTWLFIIVFLGIAAYLIFGSWLNYNRYGARGWDLLPHGDTLRDVPYLIKDWVRRVLNTVQGTGSRGGYSAV
ncbi:hypothetical protein NLU13_6210 [Sarocladium strictum]|uniref:Autophagy-related protein 27 n=1 Tax=Sarocladium strictum TaxID=5046 RepID=A0AA39L6W7_SARSR|nr:hypothetical protein NLU13_6210 [Sarocladium strictum]